MKRNLSSEQQLFVSLFFFSERQGSRESSNQHDSSLFPLRSTHTHEHVGAHNVLDFNCISLGFVTYRRTQVRGLFRAPKEKEKKKKKLAVGSSQFGLPTPPQTTSPFFFFSFQVVNFTSNLFFFLPAKAQTCATTFAHEAHHRGVHNKKKKPTITRGQRRVPRHFSFPLK